MPALPPETVRAYDIRGLAPEQIDAAAAEQVARGFAAWLGERGASSAAVGRDARATSPELYEAIVGGLTAAGVRVEALGLCPTPVVGWAVDQLELGGGLIVTASHNPPEYNGFKLLGAEALPLLSDEIAAVARGGERRSASRAARRDRDIAPDYLELLAARFPRSGLRVAVDPGNGVVGRTGPPALAALTETAHAIHHTIMPSGPHIADPQEPSTMIDLANAVTTLGLDLGIAWDADGDRVGVVDHLGRRYEADWLTALLARPLLERRPGATVLLDAKASRSAIDDIAAQGGSPQIAPTGYPRFRRRMREQRIAFGGETSGHIMFGPDYLGGERYPWLDDGVYAACALACWLDRSGQSLAEAASAIRARPASPELRLPCPDEQKAAVAAAIGDWHADRFAVDRSDGARIDYGDGWAHARPSNTAPVLSLRFEADTLEAYAQIQEQLLTALKPHHNVQHQSKIAAPPTLGPQPPAERSTPPVQQLGDTRRERGATGRRRDGLAARRCAV